MLENDGVKNKSLFLWKIENHTQILAFNVLSFTFSHNKKKMIFTL